MHNPLIYIEFLDEMGCGAHDEFYDLGWQTHGWCTELLVIWILLENADHDPVL